MKAQHLVAPGKARDMVLETLKACAGNAREAARQLNCSYTTLWRLISADKELMSKVLKLRKRLAEQGVRQKGWADK